MDDLCTMVSIYMDAFDAPDNRHGWCQRWWCDVRNHLASRKIQWRTPIEKLLGDTPDISIFCFHFCETIGYLDPTKK